MITWQAFVSTAFIAMIGWLGASAISVLKSLKDSVDELNIKVGSIIEKTAWHEKELERHNQRIDRLESAE